MPTLVYIFILIFELLFLIGFSSFVLSLLWSSSKGAPYIPTKKKIIDSILKELNPKRGKIFYELGCGDGRVLRAAVFKYKVKGYGIDVNPFLIWFAKFLTSRESLKNCTFAKQNIFGTNISKADYVYLFLMPDSLMKLVPKFKKELKKGAIIISHGFKIEEFKSKLIRTVPNVPFATYYYQM